MNTYDRNGSGGVVFRPARAGAVFVLRAAGAYKVGGGEWQIDRCSRGLLATLRDDFGMRRA